MTMTLLNENELIIYDNIRSITEYETYIALHPLEDRLVTIEVNRHLIASSDEIIIDKRCFVCDEIYLDFDNRIIKKQVLNSAFGKEVMRSDKNNPDNRV